MFEKIEIANEEKEAQEIIMCYHNVLGVRNNREYWRKFGDAISYLSDNGYIWNESEDRYTY